jgi:hypothetical protein
MHGQFKNVITLLFFSHFGLFLSTCSALELVFQGRFTGIICNSLYYASILLATYLYGGVVYASVVLFIELYDVSNDDMWVTYSDSRKEEAPLNYARQFHS